MVIDLDSDSENEKPKLSASKSSIDVNSTSATSFSAEKSKVKPCVEELIIEDSEMAMCMEGVSMSEENHCLKVLTTKDERRPKEELHSDVIMEPELIIEQSELTPMLTAAPLDAEPR